MGLMLVQEVEANAGEAMLRHRERMKENEIAPPTREGKRSTAT